MGFRWFVERVADELAVAGYVRNQHDGSVEVYAIGSREQLDQLRRLLERGPRGALVSTVDEGPAPVRPYNSFRIEF